MDKRNLELEMYAAVDPRVALVNALHWARCPAPVSPPGRAGSLAAARRAAQWPTWQMDRSWSDRSAARVTIECLPPIVRRQGLRLSLAASAFMALGITAAGLLAVGIEKGLLLF